MHQSHRTLMIQGWVRVEAAASGNDYCVFCCTQDNGCRQRAPAPVANRESFLRPWWNAVCHALQCSDLLTVCLPVSCLFVAVGCQPAVLQLGLCA
jgi:hypothetical protein